MTKMITLGLVMAVMISCAQAVEMSVNQTQSAIIHVKDFGAIPNDGSDDTVAILKAIDHLKQSGANVLQFDAGRYDINRNGMNISKISDLTIQGQVDANGKPATRLVRNNDFYTNQKGIGRIIELGHCPRLTLKNLLFDNDPQYASAGQVVKIDDAGVTVKIFDGLPRVDGMGAYCMNAWDMNTRRLKHQTSLTFGHDVNKNPDELSWKVIGDQADRLMLLPSVKIASQVQVGDGLSWHNGFWGYQLLIHHSDNLTLSNLWTVNAAGFAMCTQRCNNITADNIVIRSENNQLAVSPRDGWKLYACTGKVMIRDMYIEGVRWDGQNVHGSFLTVLEKQSDHQVLCVKRYSTPWTIKAGSKITFWDGTQTVDGIVKNCQVKPDGKQTLFSITLDSILPEFTARDTLITVWDWDIAHYQLDHCTFRHIAGCAGILRNSHALIQNCTYDNIMYPALMIGAAINEGEGMFPQDVTVRNTKFVDSGWVKRNEATGMLAARTWGSDLPQMGKITVEDCTFEDAPLGINLYCTKQVILKNNRFENVQTPIQIDQTSVLDVKAYK
jgi:hypothetical protein